MAKMGRPKKDDPNNLQLNIKINSNLLDRLNEYAEKTGKTRSEIIRTAIESYLEGIKK